MLLRQRIRGIVTSARRSSSPIDKLFSENTKKGDILDFLVQHTPHMSTSEVIHCMYMCSKYDIKLKSSHLKIVASKLANENKLLVAPQIGKAIYSLQKYSCNTPPERQIITSLTAHLDNCMDIFNSHSASNMLYGLQQMSSNEIVVRKLLDIMSIKVARCPDSFSGSEVASALYGFRNMDSSHYEVRNLLMWITQKIEFSHSLDMSGMVLSNCLYGIRCMKSEHREVEYLLEVLSMQANKQQKQQQKHLQRTSAAALSGRDSVETVETQGSLLLSSQGLVNALYGLKGLSSDSPAVREMLSVVTSRIPPPMVSPQSSDTTAISAKKRGTVQLRAQHLATALYGLQRLDSRHAEVRALLAVLVPHIESSVGALSPRHVGMALKGFSCMRSVDSELVTRAMQALAMILQRSIDYKNGPVDVQAVVMALTGLRGMDSTAPEVRAVVRVLIPLVEHCSRNTELVSEDFRALSVAATLSGLSGGLSLRHREVRHLVSALLPLIERCQEVLWPEAMAVAISGLSCVGRIGPSDNTIDNHKPTDSTEQVENEFGDRKDVIDSDAHSEVDMLSVALLRVVLSKLRVFDTSTGLAHLSFTPSQLCMAIGGLRNLGGALDGVDEMLQILVKRTIIIPFSESDNSSADDASSAPEMYSRYMLGRRLDELSVAVCALENLSHQNVSVQQVASLVLEYVQWLGLALPSAASSSSSFGPPGGEMDTKDGPKSTVRKKLQAAENSLMQLKEHEG